MAHHSRWAIFIFKALNHEAQLKNLENIAWVNNFY